MPFIADDPMLGRGTPDRRVTIILDASGSMGSARDVTIETLNGYIAKLTQEKGLTILTAWIFTTDQANKPRIDRLYADLPADLAVGHISVANYDPTHGLNTPLFDAVGTICNGIKDDIKTLVVVLTDGLENASREYDGAAIRALIKDREAKGWTFVFLGADLSQEQARRMSGVMGMSTGNTMSYAKGATETMSANLSAGTSRYMANHSASTQEFFKADEQDVKAGDKKK